MALPSTPALFLRLLALVTLAHANIMVETIDGTFVPWSFVRRAGTGLGIRLTNVNDAAYVVSLIYLHCMFTTLLITLQTPVLMG